jgi:hypothetical protein
VVGAGMVDASIPKARVGAGVWEVGGASVGAVVMAEVRARAGARAAEAGMLEVRATSIRQRGRS